MASAFARTLGLSCAAACFSLLLGVAPAQARTHHHHHSRHHPIHSSGSLKATGSLHAAQAHLAHLGYDVGSVDGRMGQKTRAALKRFQKEHELKADGALGPKTIAALEAADFLRPTTTGTLPPMTGSEAQKSPPSVFPDALGDKEIDPQHALAIGPNGRTLSSRFAHIDVKANDETVDQPYTVLLEGAPILMAHGQPSVIGISPTYDLGTEDAIIFTTYVPLDSVCPYRHHVLALTVNGDKMVDIDNCTRLYTARVENGSLFISFPEMGSGRAASTVWRLEGMDLEKL